MRTAIISLASVVTLEGALRVHKMEDATIVNLANDIEKRGLLNMFSVSENGDGTFTLQDGASRFTAIKLLSSQGKWLDESGNPTDQISVQVREQMDEDQILANMIAGNFTVSKTTNPEYIRALYKLTVHDDPTKRQTLEQVAATTGLTVEYINRLFKTLKLPENVQALLNDGSMSIANAVRLSDIVKFVDEEELAEWVEKAVTLTNGELSPAIESRIKEVRQGVKKSEAGFTAVPKLLDKATLSARFELAQAKFNTDPSAENEARLNVFKEIFQMDEASIAKAKADYEKKKEDAKLAAEKRKQDREANSIEDAKKKLIAAGILKADGTPA